MPQIGLFDRTIGLLQKTLDLRLQNQQVISANIANAHTPGYRAVRLEFEDGLKQALTNTNSGAQPVPTEGHFPVSTGDLNQVQARVVRSDAPSSIGDRNSVSLDQEMLALAENQLLYETATQIISKKFALLSYVIQEGK